MSTEALLQLLISCGGLSVLMRKRNVILFPSVPYLNHPPVPFSSSLLLIRQMQPSNLFFAQVYTFFAPQIFSLISSTSFFGTKRRLGMTTHLQWFLETVPHSYGTYSRVVCNNHPTHIVSRSLQIFDQVVRSGGCPDLRPTQQKARLQKRHGIH